MTASSPASCTRGSAGYHVGDIEFSAAFDIDARKVGTDLSEAIVAAPNNTVKLRRGARRSASPCSGG